ncbi:MAG: DUF86 domain-containing protein [Armatimonadota bacterium]
MTDIQMFLSDILRHMEYALEFTNELSYDEFVRDRKTQFAVLRCLEVIGEAAKNVPAEVREHYPQVPWKAMAGMRDRLIHSYFGVSLEKVWQTVSEVIPSVMPQIAQIIEQLQSEGQEKPVEG